MLKSLRQLFNAPLTGPAAAVPPGSRVYAVGDIHGRLDLLRALAAAIEADDAARDRAQTTVVLLGDLVDRGPDSAGVVAFARDWQARRPVRILMGNHEEMLLGARGSDGTMREFLRHGGRETLFSYGVDPRAYGAADLGQVRALMEAAIPPADLAFIAGFEDMVAIGGYRFVHAGVRPGVPFDRQSRADLRWLREPFLSHTGDIGACVVHGHTITAAPELRRHRIGIDTGAYRSGRLTAVGLEGDARWFIEADGSAGPVKVSQRSIA